MLAKIIERAARLKAGLPADGEAGTPAKPAAAKKRTAPAPVTTTSKTRASKPRAQAASSKGRSKKSL